MELQQQAGTCCTPGAGNSAHTAPAPLGCPGQPIPAPDCIPGRNPSPHPAGSALVHLEAVPLHPVPCHWEKRWAPTWVQASVVSVGGPQRPLWSEQLCSLGCCPWAVFSSSLTAVLPFSAVCAPAAQHPSCSEGPQTGHGIWDAVPPGLRTGMSYPWSCWPYYFWRRPGCSWPHRHAAGLSSGSCWQHPQLQCLQPQCLQPVLLLRFNSIHSDIGPAMQLGFYHKAVSLGEGCGKQYQCCAEVQKNNFGSLSSSTKWVTLSQKEMELVR